MSSIKGFHETIAPDEAARFEGYAAELDEIQRVRAEKRGAVSRALHAKQHIGVVGELVVGTVEPRGEGVFSENLARGSVIQAV